MTRSNDKDPTSVRIDKDVHERTKAVAWWAQRTKDSIVEEALRDYLNRIDEQPIPDGASLNRAAADPAWAGDSAESPRADASSGLRMYVSEGHNGSRPRNL